MCRGRYIRFLCPESLAGNPQCPHYDPATGNVHVFASLWQQMAWVCCGNHAGDCVTCPALFADPAAIEVFDACALACDPCGARLMRELEEEEALLAEQKRRDEALLREENLMMSVEQDRERNEEEQEEEEEEEEMIGGWEETADENEGEGAEEWADEVCGCPDCQAEAEDGEFGEVCGCPECQVKEGH